MWKKLLYLAVIIWMSKPIQSAVLECNWDPSMQTCKPYNISAVTQPNEVITISGQLSDFVNPTTIYLPFSKQVINYIPSGLFTIFPKLESLVIEECGTTTLTTNSIPNCGILNTFILTGGTFTNIPASFLESCTSLTNFSISQASVSIIDADAFRGLTNVETITISKTQISCLPPDLFKYTLKLSKLDLWSNMITSIDSNLLVNLPALSNVNLGQNQITYVPMLNLTGLMYQKGLINFNLNPIYAISPDFCTTFETINITYSIGFENTLCIPTDSLARIITSGTCKSYSAELQNCYSNWTSSMNAPVPCPIALPPTTMAPTTEVATTLSPTPGSCPSDKICRYFLDQYNRYTCILDGVDSVLTSISGNHLITFTDVHVRRIVFTNSFLSRIPSILFQKFASLEYLEAPNCSISVMNTNTFTECGNLRYFDVGYNLFTTVDGASLKRCSALEVVDLTGNKIDFISGQLFVNNPTLKTVYINKPPVIVLV